MPPTHPQGTKEIVVRAPPPAESQDTAGSGGGAPSPSPSRWPKAEVHALIQLRTELETRYQDSGPKGPLWEDISSGMRRLGYNRSAKRCKEKWENINKYFRKAKESGKKRPAHAKTCPYFDELDRLYSRSGHSAAAARDGEANAGGGEAKQASSELLDAVVKYPDVRYGPPGFGMDREQVSGGNNNANNEGGEDDGDGEEDGIGKGRAGDDQDDDEVDSHGHDDE